MWLSYQWYPFCTLWIFVYPHLSIAQPVLTGRTDMLCPGDPIVVTCEAKDVTAQNPLIVWTIRSVNGSADLDTSTLSSALDGGVSVSIMYGEGTVTIRGNFSESRTLTVELQVNASLRLNGATIQCFILQLSNLLSISVRSEGPPLVSSLGATGSVLDSLLTLLSWMSTPLANSYTITITPSPLGYTGPLTSPDTNVTVLLSYNQPYRISVYGTNCGTTGDSVSINYTIVQCDGPRPPENGVIVAVSGREEGGTLTFQCNSGFTPIGAIASVCTLNGDWLPDPSTFQCSPVTCKILQTPSNGSSNFSSEPSFVGTKVHFQCDPGLYPEGVRVATCLESGHWNTDISQLVCRERPVNCSIPSEPVNGVILNYAELVITEGSVITFQCDPGFSPAAEMTATCNSSGQWSTDPSQLVCIGSIEVSLSTGQAVGITVVVMFAVSVLIGLAVGVGVTYLIMRNKTHKTVDVPTEAPPQQQQPTPGPLYEEVAPGKEDIELKTNEAYGPVGEQ